MNTISKILRPSITLLWPLVGGSLASDWVRFYSKSSQLIFGNVWPSSGGQFSLGNSFWIHPLVELFVGMHFCMLFCCMVSGIFFCAREAYLRYVWRQWWYRHIINMIYDIVCDVMPWYRVCDVMPWYRECDVMPWYRVPLRLTSAILKEHRCHFIPKRCNDVGIYIWCHAMIS